MLFSPQLAFAEIYNAPINSEHKTILAISQYFSIEVVTLDVPRDNIFVEHTEDTAGTHRIRILPTSATGIFKLIDSTPSDTRGYLNGTSTSGSHLSLVTSNDYESLYSFSGNDLIFYTSKPESVQHTVDRTHPTATSADSLVSMYFKSPTILKPTQVSLDSAIAFPIPDTLTPVTLIYQYEIHDTTAVDLRVPLSIKIKYTGNSNASKKVYYFDNDKQVWLPLPSYNDVERRVITAQSSFTHAVIAVLADTQRLDGIASWYAYKKCLCAASTIYPKGSMVKVTRLKSGKSVIVKINDYGPEAWTGRLIDLDKIAFKMLGNTSAGLIYVRTELYQNKK